MLSWAGRTRVCCVSGSVGVDQFRAAASVVLAPCKGHQACKVNIHIGDAGCIPPRVVLLILTCWCALSFLFVLCFMSLRLLRLLLTQSDPTLCECGIFSLAPAEAPAAPFAVFPATNGHRTSTGCGYTLAAWLVGGTTAVSGSLSPRAAVRGMVANCVTALSAAFWYCAAMIACAALLFCFALFVLHILLAPVHGSHLGVILMLFPLLQKYPILRELLLLLLLLTGQYLYL